MAHAMTVIRRSEGCTGQGRVATKIGAMGSSLPGVSAAFMARCESALTIALRYVVRRGKARMRAEARWRWRYARMNRATRGWFRGTMGNRTGTDTRQRMSE